MPEKILIADDEREIVELLSLYLSNEGYQVFKAYDGLEALEQFNSNQLDLVILDIMMPGMDGFQLVKKIREKSNIPLIFLSARSEDVDKILGLGLGADDYITKPFSPLEVLARVKAQLRRFYKLNESKRSVPEVLKIGQIELDTGACTVKVAGETVEVTSLEFRLLKFFMEHAGQVFTKKQIFEQVWREPYMGDDNTIMVHLSRLREKIEPNPSHPIYLTTIRGIGYRFERRVKDER
ncbi:DNA-binding response regulator [Anoxybacter fermentans]|uniref:Stage 0 sporulation protein A homolog n=1 Tax=Anoxybacter fermentans TaxID=1323375 RepID=A0A3S9T1U8_9FIRM|nr:response regulator transcription factor [Anoxybacter fermentans]AZR74531.1 DNA-binding response regulator [Anoxybacter fermentans]